MMRGMYSAISGLEAHQTMLDVTANNLANVDTIGYKAQRTTFVDQLSENLSAATGPNGFNGGSNAKQVGLGVDVGSIDNLMGTGSQQTTGNALDVYIQGDGFLQVGNGAPGTTAPYTSNLPSTVDYTRAGNLKLNSSGFLTTQSGQYVVGSTAPSSSSSAAPTYINVPPGSTNLAIGQDGSRELHRRELDEPDVRPDGERPATSRWPASPTRPASSVTAAPTGARPRAPARRPPAPRASAASARRSPARWRCPTSTSPPSSPT